MVNRVLMVLVTALASMLVVFPASAQSSKAHASIPVDLDARLKSVQGDPRQLEVAYKAGASVANFCANCHGAGGNSLAPDIPNLAGQNASYLIEQLRQFSDGRRRNEFMERMIKALSPDEKVGIVVFYASQEVTHKPASDVKLAAKGHEYFSKICFRCHGVEGRGGEKTARIAGQQANYLALTLKRYRDGSISRASPLMAANTKNMTDDDIAAVVAFVSSMK